MNIRIRTTPYLPKRKTFICPITVISIIHCNSSRLTRARARARIQD